MKKCFYTLSLLFLMIVVVSSCDNREDPDFPVYATYHVNFNEVSFEGPKEMKNDIDKWIKENSITFDEFVSNSNNDNIDYSKADSLAIVKYDKQVRDFKQFLAISIFRLFLKEYGEDRQARVAYTASISRVQAGSPILFSQKVELKFP